MNEMIETMETPKKSVIRKLGFAGFMFFFVKGLLWLIVPAIAMALT